MSNENMKNLWKGKKNTEFDDQPNGRVEKYALLFIRRFFFRKSDNKIIRSCEKDWIYIYDQNVIYVYMYGQIFATRGIRSQISSFFFIIIIISIFDRRIIFICSAHTRLHRQQQAAHRNPKTSENDFFNPFFISHRVCLYTYVYSFTDVYCMSW